MKSQRTTRTSTSYLDVSEFIIKEHSPLYKPASPKYGAIAEMFSQDRTPEIAPIDHDPSHFKMTPVARGIIQDKIQDFMEDFMLDPNDQFCLEPKTEGKRKKVKAAQTRDCNQFLFFRFQNDLERIIEDEREESDDNSYEDSSSESEDSYSQAERNFQKSNSIQTHWSFRGKEKDCANSKDTQQQKQSTIDLSIAEFTENIQRFNKNPKLEIFKQMKDIERNIDGSDEEKKILIKKLIEKYLLEHQSYCYEESWKELNDSLKATIKTIAAGLEETFSKKIGFLPFEVRRTKLLKYLEKKKKRIWRKKVSYDCRKKVADGRLRIKGKFVTREQACEQLGLQNLDNFTSDEIKEMLERKIDEGLFSQFL